MNKKFYLLFLSLFEFFIRFFILKVFAKKACRRHYYDFTSFKYTTKNTVISSDFLVLEFC